VILNAGTPAGYGYTADLGPVGETRAQVAAALGRAPALPPGTAVKRSYRVPRIGMVAVSSPGGGGLVGGAKSAVKAAGSALASVGGTVACITMGIDCRNAAGEGGAQKVVNGVVNTAQCVGSGMDCLTKWVVNGASKLDEDVMVVAAGSSAPQLGSAWFAGVYQYVEMLGAGVAALFMMVGLAGAAVRRSSRELGETLLGVVRAGWGCGMAVAAIVAVLGVCDQLAAGIAGQVPRQFFDAISTGWGASGFGGFGSSFIAFVVALVMVLAEMLLWLELVIRGALLYVMVGVLPLVLGAAVSPALNAMLRKVLVAIGIVLVLPVVAMIALLIGAAVVGGGLSVTGGGVTTGAATTILEGVAVFLFASLTPWGLLALVGLEAGVIGRDRGAASDRVPGGAVGGALVSGAVGGGQQGALGGGTSASASTNGASTNGASTNGGAPAGGGGGEGNPTRGSAGSSGASRPRPTTGAVAAAAGWLSGAAAVGGNVAQHVGARAAAATGRNGSAPAAMSWNAIGGGSRSGASAAGQARGGAAQAPPGAGNASAQPAASPAATGSQEAPQTAQTPPAAAPAGWARDAAGNAVPATTAPSVEGLPAYDAQADPFGGDLFDPATYRRAPPDPPSNH
jgi:hypothetical protein